MKKTLLLLSMSVLTFFVQAQIKLDSVIIVEDSKQTFTYDAHGNPTLLLQQTWNTATSRWENAVRETRAYNAEGQLTQDVIFHWDTPTGTWKGWERYTWTYSPSGSELIWEAWQNATNSWRPFNRFVSSFNAAGQITEGLNYSWENDTWDLRNRHTYAYDAQGNTLEKVIQNRTQTAWVDLERNTWVYDAENRLIEETYEFFLVNVIFDRKRHFYNPDGTLASSDDYDFSATSGWFYTHPAAAYEYSYSPEGELSERIVYRWNEALGDLDESQKETYTYDGAGNVLDFSLYFWNTFQQNWIRKSREVKTYDLSIEIAELIYPAGYESVFEQAATVNLKTYDRNPALNDWQLYLDTYYYFSAFTTDIDEAPGAEALKLFPNPVGDVLTLAANAPTASGYQITDLSGRVLQQEKAWNGTGIDVSRLAAGSYVIRLVEGRNTLVSKFIKF